jgi:hypothetical protein
VFEVERLQVSLADWHGRRNTVLVQHGDLLARRETDDDPASLPSYP